MPVEDRLKKLGLALPAAPAPVGAYVPYVEARGLLFISGQIPLREGKLTHRGKVGAEVTLPEAQACARTCFLNALAQAQGGPGKLGPRAAGGPDDGLRGLGTGLHGPGHGYERGVRVRGGGL